MEDIYPICCALLLLITCFLLFSLPKNKKLPPGPWRWPLVGNLPQISKQRLHVDLPDLARVHGPLFSLRLGTKQAVVATSPAVASELLKTHDKNVSSRFVPHTYRINDYAPYCLVFAADCDDRWKSLRSICKTELFTVRTLDMHSKMREEKVWQLVESLAQRDGKEVKIALLVFKTIFNILGNVIISKDVFDDEKSAEANSLKSTFARMLELGHAMNVADLFPALGMLDLQGLNKECDKIIRSVYQVWNALIEERINDKDSSSKLDFLSILLSANVEHNQILALLTDMFIAGTDTSTTTVEWAMSELIKKPEIMAKARSEVERVVGRREKGEINMVKESHLNQLSYTHACIKETLRLHPPAPLILRRAKEECKVLDYTIPEETRVMVNIWAIGRDFAVWDDPQNFLPERFVNGSRDYKGNDFEFTPFGAGRRICPGMPLASRLMVLILASLVHNFNWSLPIGMNPEELEMGEKFSLVLERAKPLILVPTSSI